MTQLMRSLSRSTSAFIPIPISIPFPTRSFCPLRLTSIRPISQFNSRNSSITSNQTLLSKMFTQSEPTDDPRMGDILRTIPLSDLSSSVNSTSSSLASVVFTGFPYDEGCRRNGGRVGAENGPSVVRRFVQRMGTVVNPELNIDLSKVALYDVGDVEKGMTLEDAHKALEERVLTILQSVKTSSGAPVSSPKPVIPFVVGGSNDQSYPNAMALLRSLGHAEVGVINIDAHFDVRPLKNGLAHSGSPFRLMMEDSKFAHKFDKAAATGSASSSSSAATQQTPSLHFIEFASQGNQCSAEHASYIHSKRSTQILWLTTLREKIMQAQQKAAATATSAATGSTANSSKPPSTPASLPYSLPLQSPNGMALQFLSALDSFTASHLFISFDLDAVRGADAPGVSCPGTVGLTAAEACDMALVAGAHRKVSLFDLSEFNPAVDEYRTGRLVANMFYFFSLGVAARMQGAVVNAPAASSDTK